MPRQLSALANLQVCQKRVERMRTQSPLRKTDPAVLPHLLAVTKELLQLEVGLVRGLTAGAAACNVFQEARVADGNWKIAGIVTPHHHGLQLVFTSRRYISGCKGLALEPQRARTSLSWRARQDLIANRHECRPAVPRRGYLSLHHSLCYRLQAFINRR